MPQTEANQPPVPASALQQQVQRSKCTLSSESTFVEFNSQLQLGKNKTKQQRGTLLGLHVLKILEGYCISSLVLLEVSNSFLLVVTSPLVVIDAQSLACS